jgi:Tol biopolymer transport system component
MTTDRDPNVLLATWLDEGPRDLPSETRRAIETAVRTMPQRRLGFGRSWRFPLVNGSLRPALLVVAILISIVGVAIYGRLRPSDQVGSGGVLPSASPSATASVSPTVAPLVGRIAFTRYDSVTTMYGDYLGTYTANADGTGEVKLDLPVSSDGVEWSPDGTKLLIGNSVRESADGWRPAIVDADGTGWHQLDTPGTFGDMSCTAWSPDGTRLLCGVADAKDAAFAGIVTIDATTGAILQRISSDAPPGVKGTTSECGGGDSPGAWSPDGTKVVFVRHHCGIKPDPVKDETAEMFIANADGSGSPTVIVPQGSVYSSEPQVRWSPDGQRLVFSDGQIATVRPDGSDLGHVVTDERMSFQYSPAWSPDADWIVFSGWSQGGSTDLWAVRVDGSDTRRLMTNTASEDSVSWTR